MFQISTTIIKGKGRGKSILGHATANAQVTITELHSKNIPTKYRNSIEGAWSVNIVLQNTIKRGQPIQITDKEVNAVCGVCKKGFDLILDTHIGFRWGFI